MCANYTKARQVAVNFPGAYQEINRGKYGTAEFYPHFHINEEHGEPHIWFYPGNN